MDNTIRVTGKGEISVQPDMVRLILELVKVQGSYEDALKTSASMTEELKSCFEIFGFSRTEVKTVSFKVDTKYERYYDEANNWKQRFAGYEFKHILKVEFPVGKELLGSMLAALSQCDADPLFRLHYYVRDTASVKDALLDKAVADSKRTAGILARASGVKLGSIKTIDYSWTEMEIVAKTLERSMEMPRSSDSTDINLDIEPDLIKVTDHVTMIWNLS